ncbi:MAG: M48 family metalloprotease [Betaproteobacteria bacterium]|nr:M48 family metalloprotease [Betaproteobacteria bacterium]
MDFFRSQRQARRQTLIFLALFTLIVTLVVVLCAAVVGFSCLIFAPEKMTVYARNTGIVVLLIIIGASIVRSTELHSGGGAVIARHLGGEPLPLSRLDHPYFQRFRNVAQEMAIASRTPMPTLYWLPNEPAINAFVAGFTTADAVLAVTRGTLERLSRDELQGVIAHEFSHLLNGDMRLNTQVASWLFGVYAVYTYGRSILSVTALGSNRDDGFIRPGNWPLAIFFGGALTVIGYIGKLGGRLLQAAISRQRETLADASAVQFTRQTLGLAGALKKIYYGSSYLQSPQSDTYSHFFLGDAIETSQLFATHPPLVERIRALDPKFDPDDNPLPAVDAHLDVDALDKALPLYFNADSAASFSGRETEFTMRDGLALLFANLLDGDNEAVRRRQLDDIEAAWGHDVSYQTHIIEPDIDSQKMYLRLTRLHLMLAQLHTLSAVQQDTLRRTLRTLIAANKNISLLEVVVAFLVARYLRDMASPADAQVAGLLRLTDCAPEMTLLQNLVVNHAKQTAAQVTLDYFDDSGKTTTANAHMVERALDRLNRLTLDEKKNLFQALYDACGRPSPEQQEMLSLLAGCLHTPPLESMVHYPGSELTLAPE